MDGPSLSPPYLVLLRAGFGLPLVLPRARCALTAPFHPYLSTHPFGVRSRRARHAESWACPERAPEGRVEGRYVFCATFLRVAPTGCYPAHCPAEFGLSSSSCDETAVWLTATDHSNLRAGQAGGAPGLPAPPALLIRPSPVRSDTARVFCTGCCEACR